MKAWVLGEFGSEHQLLEAVISLRSSGLGGLDAHSPIPIEGMSDAVAQIVTGASDSLSAGRQQLEATWALSEKRQASLVIARTGDLPPVARYRSVISWTSSGGVGRPPRTSFRYGPTASRESGPPIAIRSTPIGGADT